MQYDYPYRKDIKCSFRDEIHIASECLSPKDEFAQEHERIRHMYRVGNEANLFIWMVMLQYNPVSPSAGKGIAEWQAVYYNEARM